MSGVHAVVVTHDRKELLRECLAAIEAQHRPPDWVLVVDNASSDGTREMLARDFVEVDVLELTTNEGGAGGFHEGMKWAHAAGAEWLWLMDDDALPTPDALAALLAASEDARPEPDPALLVSKVVWRDGRLHPMNAPWPDRRRIERLMDGAARGLVPLRETTFVSLLLHRRAVDRHGLPFKDFFIWSDDIEYTSRVLAAGEEGYLVPSSVVLHNTPAPHTSAVAAPERFYFNVRNTLWIVRGKGSNGRRAARTWWLAKSVVGYLRRRPRPSSLLAVARGLRDGLGRAPLPMRSSPN